MSSDAAIRAEIARLTGAINRHKNSETNPSTTGYSRPSYQSGNTYVNPDYQPASLSRPPTYKPAVARAAAIITDPSNSTPHDVVIDGVAFQSSSRSLVRKDLLKAGASRPAPTNKPSSSSSTPAQFHRTAAGHLINSSRKYKSRSSRGSRPHGRVRGRGRGQSDTRNRNLTLDNRKAQRLAAKRLKYSDKPCPRFTTTGSCARGLTCMYLHDPAKIAVCWPFLQGNCPHTSETCNLSHDPTAQRTPVCVHFANNGRCTRVKCPFPHVRLGPREGVCRDFAVLGFCAKGLDCEHQHVRECPDFAERGVCTTKGCKLPHVIRANRNRAKTSTTTATEAVGFSPDATPSHDLVDTNDTAAHSMVTIGSGNLGDEYISLTFNESDESSEQDSEEDEDDEEDENEEEEEEGGVAEEVPDGQSSVDNGDT